MTDFAHEPRLNERDRRLLIGVADGTLSGRRRTRAEGRLARIPDAERLIARQRRVAHAVRPAGAPATRRSRLRPNLRVATVGALAAVATVCLVLILAFSGDRPAVMQAADLAGQPATRSAPSSSGHVLQASVDGVEFPDWSAEFGWHETGARDDTLDGRRTRTVFYEHMGHRIAYTIVSGAPVPIPDDARVVRRGTMVIALYRDAENGGRDIAVFRRGGRTCVLAGHVMHQSTLVELAAWIPA